MKEICKPPPMPLILSNDLLKESYTQELLGVALTQATSLSVSLVALKEQAHQVHQVLALFAARLLIFLLPTYQCPTTGRKSGILQSECQSACKNDPNVIIITFELLSRQDRIIPGEKQYSQYSRTRIKWYVICTDLCLPIHHYSTPEL